MQVHTKTKTPFLSSLLTPSYNNTSISNLLLEWCANNISQDLPTPFCKEARLTYVRMHERVQRTFSFVVSSPGGVAEAIFKVNFTVRHKTMSNSVDEADDEELSEPEEIHFPVFGSSQNPIILRPPSTLLLALLLPMLVLLIRSSSISPCIRVGF